MQHYILSYPSQECNGAAQSPYHAQPNFIAVPLEQCSVPNQSQYHQHPNSPAQQASYYNHLLHHQQPHSLAQQTHHYSHSPHHQQSPAQTAHHYSHSTHHQHHVPSHAAHQHAAVPLAGGDAYGSQYDPAMQSFALYYPPAAQGQYYDVGYHHPDAGEALVLASGLPLRLEAMGDQTVTHNVDREGYYNGLLGHAQYHFRQRSGESHRRRLEGTSTSCPIEISDDDVSVGQTLTCQELVDQKFKEADAQGKIISVDD
ncbi:expressed unknown protein [Seminavis robusta]|uniref:Uncharacterized protein n=1 Tax=Seminavis robusta TaxID=568900 RepID=A0A9N8HMK9_9STRA|nr:expressed unknown protein [Seminavis robusta]|eukprot:Sro913_g219460.1 n/a (257) ;mRNA; f:24795-25565